MAQRLSIKQDIRKNLIDGREGWNRSKHEDKIADKEYIRSAGDDFDRTKLLEKQYFYTRTTLENCLSTSKNFIDWVNKETSYTDHKRLKDVSQYSEFIPAYCEFLAENGMHTPRTIAKIRTQLGKVWLVDTAGVYVPPMRTESNKGRTPDKFYNMNSEKHLEATRFYEATGARKGEYRMLKLSEQRKYIKQAEEQYGLKIKAVNGLCPNVYPVFNEQKQVEKVIVLHGKHGKTNCSEVLPENREFVTSVYLAKGASGYTHYSDFCDPSSHCNIHACRRTYAQNLYAHYARPVHELSKKEIYATRDGTRRYFDKRALSKVALSLGHSAGDLYDTVHNYMR